MAELEGTLLLDAETFLQGAGTGAKLRRTFGLLFKGPQTAGTPKSFVLDSDASLIEVVGSPSNVYILRAPSSWNNGTFLSGGVPVGYCSVQGQFSGGNFKFLEGDTVWLDSSGGIGSGELVFLIFAVDEPDVSVK